ncbi:MAG: 30S ribosomal protein S20 [Lentisphaeraceae bacterium]|nr:30S ribosomal protein S20 [Lentisphaeraceae bacterium]
MAHNKSALKRIKQDAIKRLRNRARKSSIATSEKKFLKLLEEKNVEQAQTALAAVISAYDIGAKKGVISKAKADRKKSRLTVLLNQAQA